MELTLGIEVNERLIDLAGSIMRRAGGNCIKTRAYRVRQRDTG
jgi:hypothetical protein